jgi:hypothetical protein
MGELRDVPLSGTLNGQGQETKALSQLQAEMERMKPDIEAFKKKLEPIKAEFRRSLEALLTPEQMTILKEFRERGSSTPSASAPPPRLTTDNTPHTWHGHAGLDAMFPIVLVPITLDRLTDKLKLTPEQREDVRKLLVLRRQQFLELVDANPPPSMKLSKIAPMVPKIADPDGK